MHAITLVQAFQDETGADDNAVLSLLVEFIDAQSLAGELYAFLAEHGLMAGDEED